MLPHTFERFLGLVIHTHGLLGELLSSTVSPSASAVFFFMPHRYPPCTSSAAILECLCAVHHASVCSVLRTSLPTVNWKWEKLTSCYLAMRLARFLGGGVIILFLGYITSSKEALLMVDM